MFSLFIFDKYIFINFLRKSLKNIFPFIKYKYKDFFRYFGKEKYAVNTFIDTSWRLNSRIMKCGNIHICEIRTSGFRCISGWGEDC